MAESSISFPSSSRLDSQTYSKSAVLCGKVIASCRTIKSQQRDEPDLSVKEKHEILTKMLLHSPGDFLRRFGPEFDEEDLQYFEESADYEVQYRVKELKKSLKSKAKEKRKRNRRYKAIEELTMTGNYFSYEEMRERCPLLYEQYIGQFQSKEQRKEVENVEQGDLCLSTSRVANELDNNITLEKLKQQLKIESLDGEISDYGMDNILTLSKDPKQADDEKLMLQKEFLRLMHLRFINGEDDYDYRSIDENEEYDIHEISERDYEDAYFDSEEPCDVQNEMECTNA